MKKIAFITIPILFFLHSSVFALAHHLHTLPKCCYYYYGYPFNYSTYDYQVDTACVDICLDKIHTLQRCMRECSNYHPTYPFN